MPRRNEDVATVNDAMRDNVMGTMRHYRFFLGYSRAKTKRNLQRRYPNASNATIEAILDRYTESSRVSANINQAGARYRPQRTDIPCNPSLEVPYRYTVNMIYTNNRTGSVTRYMAVVNSQSQLSKEEIQSEGERITRSAYANKEQPGDSPPGRLPSNATVSMDVISVERRSCSR